MKHYILIAVILFSTCLSAQAEKVNFKQAASKFKLYYNSSEYDSIFNMFDEGMKTAMPLPKVKEFVIALNSQIGKIKLLEFSKDMQTTHIYKTTFDKAILNFLISLNNENKINGLYFKPYTPENLSEPERNTTKLILPFNEEWFVFWGGDTVEQNYHVEYANQRRAFDLVITENGKTYKGDSIKNENYFAFGKEIIAPCDATVVEVIDGVEDNVPGVLNPKNVTGNTVILQTKNDEFILLAHLKKSSIVVKEGQKVNTGDLLGLCGNSGNSSEAHLHFSIQNIQNMNNAIGMKTYFDKIVVNGELKEDYSPIKSEKIKNIE